jgi:hypothetical protein
MGQGVDILIIPAPHRVPAGGPFPGFQKVEGRTELTQQSEVGEADES